MEISLSLPPLPYRIFPVTCILAIQKTATMIAVGIVKRQIDHKMEVTKT
uniref:Uncharacterized protein n=1 Tax=Rhizophora mucronata TaxID=61149 RepID=A0A2P2NJS7_RHIMU